MPETAANMISSCDFLRRPTSPIQPSFEVLHSHGVLNGYGVHDHVHRVKSISNLGSPLLVSDRQQSQCDGFLEG
jgi:hypothetical protein